MNVDQLLEYERKIVAEMSPRAVAFFLLFARFEYALKRAMPLRRSSNGIDMGQVWNDFATRLGASFFEAVQSSGLAPTLLSQPPKKQTINNGALGWRDTAPPRSSQQLLEVVRRVRNNLVHGGKFPFEPVMEIGRNDVLLREALAVLGMALRDREEVRIHFLDPL